MRGTDFLDLAISLQNSDSEAGRRSAVSRAYYAVFHVARELFVDAGIGLPHTAEAHRKIQFCLMECGEDDARQAGGDLENLRVHRNAADYDLSQRRFRDNITVQSLVALAQRVITALEALRTESVWPRFRANVRTYAAQVLHLTVRSS
jgi:uncharacterized protein (UPF0332 family)